MRVELDKDLRRVYLLKEGIDYRECEQQHNIKLALLRSTITSSYSDLTGCNVFIVCVPTGINKCKQPDMEPLKEVCRSLGRIIKSGDVVIFESTVFPGTTEDICIPILGKVSMMKINKDFSVGYSPERINEGDEIHRIATIPKIISASNIDTLDNVSDFLYSP